MFEQFEMGNQAQQRAIGLSKTKQTPVLPFVVSAMGDFTCDSSYYTKRKGREDCLLLYTVEGQGYVEYEDRHTILAPGQVMLIDCRKFHHYGTYGESWKFLWMHFSGKCAFDYVDILNGDGEEAVHVGGRVSIENYYEKIAGHVSSFDLDRELEISIIMQTLLTALIRMKKSEAFTKKYGGYESGLEESISYMREHFREKLAVEHLAEICHLSKYYYIKIFKAYTGQTPYDYLINLRLQQAKVLLLETLKSVEEIALESGFSDCKNFIACFKKKVSMTPLQFRKQNQ